MQTFEVLEKALDEIRDPTNWTGEGRGEEDPHGPYCAMGAVRKALGAFDISSTCLTYFRLTDPAFEALGGSVRTFNDTHTHAEVVALFQEAIRSEKAKAGIPLEVPSEEPVVHV